MSNDSYELRFSAQMLPAVLHGLAIERNCAMMSGRTGAMMQAEFQAMLDGLARQCGIPNLLRVVDEHKWYRACDALKKAKEFHWYVRRAGVIGRSPTDRRSPAMSRWSSTAGSIPWSIASRRPSLASRPSVR